jgi:hypothetical protein
LALLYCFCFVALYFLGMGGYRCRASLGLARRLRALLVGCLLERVDVLGAADFVMVCFVLFRLVEFVWWV